MNRDEIRARIIMDTVFPLLKDFTGALPAMWPAARLIDGVAISAGDEILRGTEGERALIGLRFGSMEKLGAMMRGDPAALPGIEWKPGGGAAAAATAVTAALAALSAAPFIPAPSRRARRIRASMLLYAASYAMESVARYDAEIHNVIRETNGEIAQIGIHPDGPFIIVSFNPGEITTGRGSHPNPDAKLVFESLDLFERLLTGRKEPLKAYSEGKIRIEGESVLLLMVGALLRKAVFYVAGGKAEQPFTAPSG